MRFRIDLKIFIFFVCFYLTNQIKIYLITLFFCLLHELGHIIIGLSLGFKLEYIELMPFGFTASFEDEPNNKTLEIKKSITAFGRTNSKYDICNYLYIF